MHAHTTSQRASAPNPALFRLFVALGVVSLVLGTLGFQEADPASGMVGAIYRSAQLFTLESGAVAEPAPLSLQVARWLAPLSGLVGVVQLLRGFFGNAWKEWRAARSKDHLVIVGLGRKGKAFARSYLHASGDEHWSRIVAIDRDPDLTDFDLRSDPRLFVLVGDARDPDLWKRAAIRRAKRIVIVTDDDALNLSLSTSLRNETSRGSRTSPAEFHVHLFDLPLRDALQRSNGAKGIRLLNHYSDLARRILSCHPLETVCGRDGATDLSHEMHLLVTSLDRLQYAMILEAARVGHYLGGRKVHVHILMPGAMAAHDRLLASHPQLKECIACLYVVEAPSGTSFVRAVAAEINALPETALVTVLPSVREDADVHADVFHLREQVVGRAVRVLLPTLRTLDARAPDVGNWMHAIHTPRGSAQLGGEVGFFDEQKILDQAVGALDRIEEGMARSVHESWLRKEEVDVRNHAEAARANGCEPPTPKPTMRQWGEMTESEREQSYGQAMHMAIKVRAAGCSVQDLDAERWATVDVEPLARIEHERWMACQRLAGWVHGTVRDTSRRRHPSLVPYDQLDEKMRESDRLAVGLVPSRLPDLKALEAHFRSEAGNSGS